MVQHARTTDPFPLSRPTPVSDLAAPALSARLGTTIKGAGR